MGQIVPFSLVRAAYPDRTTRLDTAESAFLIALRWWVSGYRGDKDPVPRMCRGLKVAGARDAAFSLNIFMAIVADTALRPIEIHCPRCHGFSEDEKHLLFAACLAQEGRIGLGARALREIAISDAGAVCAMEPLQALGELFGAAGLHFTRRRSPGIGDRVPGNNAIEPWAPSMPTRTIH